MKQIKLHIASLLLALLALLALAAAGTVLLFGTAYGRVSQSYSSSTVLRCSSPRLGLYQANGVDALSSWSDVSPDEDSGAARYTLDFAVANRSDGVICVGDQQATLRVLASGLARAEDLQVELVVGNMRFTGQPQRIKEGSLLYRQVGEGWVYRFFDGSEEELSWFLAGGGFSAQEMSLRVSGGSAENDTLVTLMTAGKVSAVWRGLVARTEEAQPLLQSDLLAVDGQTVMVNQRQTSYRIPIEISLSDENDSALTLRAETDDGDWVTVAILDEAGNEVGGIPHTAEGEQRYVLSVTRTEREDSSAQTFDSPAAADDADPLDPSVPADDPDTLDPSVPEDDADTLDPSVPEDDPDTLDPSVPEDDADPLDPGVPEDEPDPLDPSVPEDDPDPLDSNVPEDVPEPTAEESEPAPAEPATVFVRVTADCGGTQLAGSFVIAFGEPDTSVAPQPGGFLQVPQQYNPALPVKIAINYQDAVLYGADGGDLPAGTRYSLNGRSTVLYDGGTISAPAKSVVSIDLSRADTSGALTLTTANHNYRLSEAERVEALLRRLPSLPGYSGALPTADAVRAGIAAIAALRDACTAEGQSEAELRAAILSQVDETYLFRTEEEIAAVLALFEPTTEQLSLPYVALPTLNTDQPLIMSGASLAVPLAYRWGELAPTVTITQMKQSNGLYVWQPAEGISLDVGEDGQIQLVSDGATPGAYKLELCWTLTGGVETRCETSFYVLRQGE